MRNGEVKHRIELNKFLPKDAVCAELGVAEGYFSAEMLQWGIKHLYMVDMWTTNTTFPGDAGFDQEWHDKNLQGALDKTSKFKGATITILRGKTVEMAGRVPDESLDLVYLDACHSYDCVMNDLQAWFPKVKPAGVIAGHDYLALQYGVYQAVTDFARGKYDVFTIPEHQNQDAGFYFFK